MIELPQPKEKPLVTVLAHCQNVHTPADSSIDCLEFASFEAAESVRDPWDTLALAAPAGLYASFDWCRLWWKHYGTGRTLKLFVFCTPNETVAILPMFVERLWIGPIWLKVARLIGSDSMPSVCSLAIVKQFYVDVMERALKHLFEGEKCDVVCFAPVVGETMRSDDLREACQKFPDLLTMEPEELMAPFNTLHLPARFEEFLAGLNAGQRQNYRRRLKLLNKAVKLEVDIVKREPSACAEFETFKRIHSEQWSARGKLGHFGDWPGSDAFNNDLVREYAKKGQLRLSKVSADGAPIAMQYSFVWGNWYYWRLTARVCQAELEKYGLGMMGAIKMIEQAIEESMQHIECGPGHYDYKEQLGADEDMLLKVSITAKRFGVRLRSALFRRASRLMHLFYYRIWFLRIAPVLPFPRRPLWKIWIRSRF